MNWRWFSHAVKIPHRYTVKYPCQYSNAGYLYKYTVLPGPQHCTCPVRTHNKWIVWSGSDRPAVADQPPSYKYRFQNPHPGSALPLYKLPYHESPGSYRPGK